MLVLAGLLASAASCDKQPTYAEFEARTWNTSCSTDADCALVPIPCDHCSGELAIAASERAGYDEYAATVSCDDYSTEDECGDAADMEAACVSGRCTARIAQPEPPEPPEPVEPEATSTCTSLREQAAALLATPSAACESDDDCGCYPAFIDCGGVRDATSAAAFGQIAGAGREADCGYHTVSGEAFNCAPWQCVPVCRNQSCGRQ